MQTCDKSFYIPEALQTMANSNRAAHLGNYFTHWNICYIFRMPQLSTTFSNSFCVFILVPQFLTDSKHSNFKMLEWFHRKITCKQNIFPKFQQVKKKNYKIKNTEELWLWGESIQISFHSKWFKLKKMFILFLETIVYISHYLQIPHWTQRNCQITHFTTVSNSNCSAHSGLPGNYLPQWCLLHSQI